MLSTKLKTESWEKRYKKKEAYKVLSVEDDTLSTKLKTEA